MTEDFILGQLQNDSKGLADVLDGITSLLTRNPESVPHAWGVINNIHNVLLPIGYSLIVLFFLMAWLKQATDFNSMSVEKTFGLLILLVISKFFMEQSFEILRAILGISHGIVSTMNADVAIPILDVEQYRATISSLGFFDKMAFQMNFMFYGFGLQICTVIVQIIVYGVFIELFVLTALSPIPISGIVNGEMSPMMKRYIQEYAAVSLQGVVIMTIIMIYNGFMAEYMTVDFSILKMMTSSILLVMMLFKSGSISRKLTGA